MSPRTYWPYRETLDLLLSDRRRRYLWDAKSDQELEDTLWSFCCEIVLAAGVVASLKAGIAPESVKRPLRWTTLKESSVEAVKEPDAGSVRVEGDLSASHPR